MNQSDQFLAMLIGSAFLVMVAPQFVAAQLSPQQVEAIAPSPFPPLLSDRARFALGKPLETN